MNSIYEKALGSDFGRLHPKIQQRFGFSSGDGVACIGRGVMDEIWHGRLYTLPFLYCGSWRSIMFPEQGRNVPFSIENYAFLDPFGRETVTWIRRFKTTTPRRFDAYMIYSERHARVVDYLGTHEHLAVDIDLMVDESGGLQLKSGAQRFYEGMVGFSFPLFFPESPMFESGMTTASISTASRSMCTTEHGDHCLGIAGLSTQSGLKAFRACPTS